MPTPDAPVSLLKIGAVMQRSGLARVTIYKRMAAGTFPRPVYPAPRAPRWRSDEIASWIERLSAEREDQGAAAA